MADLDLRRRERQLAVWSDPAEGEGLRRARQRIHGPDVDPHEPLESALGQVASSEWLERLAERGPRAKVATLLAAAIASHRAVPRE